MTALAGRVAVVTGASRGIGRAVSAALAAEGATVIMVARSADVLTTAAAEIGAHAVPLVSDLAVAGAAEVVAERVRQSHGDPSLLVNNAGAFTLRRVEETSDEELQTMLQVNLLAPFALTRALLPAMRAAGAGHVVTIGSIADHVAFPENGAYAASKYGVRALHEVLRAELRGSGVRATLVSPAPVDTPLWDPIDPDSRAGFTPRRDMLSADAVASAVLFALTRPPEVNVDELRISRS
jgi:NADP-dependent 3-hydroxy acid dehydrogenase YdfG